MGIKVKHPINCKCGKSTKLSEKDDWWIDAPKYYNCFWVYMSENNRPHTLNEVSTLLNLSIAAIPQIENSALSKIRNKVTKI